METEFLAERSAIIEQIKKLSDASAKVRVLLEENPHMSKRESALLMGKRRVYASQRRALEAKLSQLKATHAEAFEAVNASNLARMKRDLAVLIELWKADGKVVEAAQLEAVLG